MWQSLEEGAGKRCSECDQYPAFVPTAFSLWWCLCEGSDVVFPASHKGEWIFVLFSWNSFLSLLRWNLMYLLNETCPCYAVHSEQFAAIPHLIVTSDHRGRRSGEIFLWCMWKIFEVIYFLSIYIMMAKAYFGWMGCFCARSVCFRWCCVCVLGGRGGGGYDMVPTVSLSVKGIGVWSKLSLWAIWKVFWCDAHEFHATSYTRTMKKKRKRKREESDVFVFHVCVKSGR